MIDAQGLVNLGKAAKVASRELGKLPSQQKNVALLAMAKSLRDNQAAILVANQADIENTREAGRRPESFIERMTLTESRIDDMAAELDGLRFRVDADDPLLSFAREYLTYVRWTVYPQAKDIYFITPLPARTDRTFTPEEFFLQDPHPVSTRWELATARARRLSARLPAGLRVAVVNDFSFFRKRVTELHRQERLFADGTLRTYASADELLDAVLTRGERYDVIFTDIIIASGGGGYYLASELRQSGYNGVIIALSSYAPEEELGRKMFDRGLDGMISLEGGAEYKRGWPADLMQKLLNHYYYRDLHGWIR